MYILPECIGGICGGLASVARNLCTTYVHPQGITPLVVSRLIAMGQMSSRMPNRCQRDSETDNR